MKFLSLLASATLFSGMMLFSFGFAPLVFKTLDVGEAGRMLRLAFPWYYLFVFAIAALGAALLFSVDQSSLGNGDHRQHRPIYTPRPYAADQ